MAVVAAPFFCPSARGLTSFATVEIFGSGDSPENVAAQWYSRYQANNAAAVTELVNCILQCAGCDQEVSEDDIQDPDNCHHRLIDLQNIYQEVRALAAPCNWAARRARILTAP